MRDQDTPAPKRGVMLQQGAGWVVFGPNRRNLQPTTSDVRTLRTYITATNERPSEAVEGTSDSRSSRTRKELVGANMRRARERVGMTQFALAEQLGIARKHLSDYERGIHEPGAERLERIADLLGIAETAYFFLEPLPDLDAEADAA